MLLYPPGPFLASAASVDLFAFLFAFVGGVVMVWAC
jgi:hypothetical protein